LISIGLVWLACLAVDLVAIYVARRGKRSGDLRVDDLLVPFIRAIMQIIVIAIGLVVIAENFGVEVTGILAGLGLGGIAIALAAQDTLGNFFGSLAILMERPFRAGDFVKVDKVEGTVVEVGLRSTRIRTPDESIVTLPNSTLAKASVDNLGARAYRRWFATIGVTYDTPPDKIDAFCRGIRELIVGRENLRQDVVQVSMYNFGPSSLDIRLVCFFDTSNFEEELAARHRLALDIMRLANELGVDFAFPTNTIHFQQTEPISVVTEKAPAESRA
jgi:MscS family membrane protein